MTRATRVYWSLLTAALLLLCGAGVASADPKEPVPLAPQAVRFITLEDSRGIPMWHYELSIDRGGVTSPLKVVWAAMTEFLWGIYQSVVSLALWFVKWALGMGWLERITGPVTTVANGLTQVINDLGLVPVLLTVSALVAGLLFLRGRYATAIYDVAAACVIAALASGVLAQPVQMVTGPNGLIVQASETGSQLAADVSAGEHVEQTPQQLVNDQTGRLVDVFVRQPLQLINYGMLLDGGPCEDVYTTAVREGPYGQQDTLRETVGDCDEAAGDYAANPTSGMALSAMVFTPAAAVILTMAVMLGGSVVLAGLWAVYLSLKAIIVLVTGLLPGGARGSLLLTASELVVALVTIVFTSVFLAVFLRIVTAVFASGGSPSRNFLIVDVLLVAGLIVYQRQKRSLKNAARRMAEWLAQRPGAGAPARLPSPATLTVGAATMAAVGQYTAHRRHKKELAAMATHGGAGNTYNTSSLSQTLMVFGAGGPKAVGGPTSPNPQPPSDPAPPSDPPPNTPSDPPMPSPDGHRPPIKATATRVTSPKPPVNGTPRTPIPGRPASQTRSTGKALVVSAGKKAVKAAGTAAAAAATGGSSAAAATAVKAAKAAKTTHTTARRAQVAARLAAARKQQQITPASRQIVPARVVPSTPKGAPPATENPSPPQPAVSTPLQAAAPLGRPARPAIAAVTPADPQQPRRDNTPPTAGSAQPPAPPKSAQPPTASAATAAERLNARLAQQSRAARRRT